MSRKVGLEVLVVGGDNPSTEGNAPLPANEISVQKTRPQAQTTAFILPAPSSTLVGVRNGEGPRGHMEPLKGGGAGEPVTSALTPQVGGACSVVHVLEWKEGVAVLPGTNLKFRMNDFGTLEVVSDRKVPFVDPSAEGAAGKEMETDGKSALKPDSSIDKKKTLQYFFLYFSAADPFRLVQLNPELLKPVKKRKRKDYMSPSEEESEMEAMEEKLEELKSCGPVIEGRQSRAGYRLTMVWLQFCYTKHPIQSFNIHNQTIRDSYNSNSRDLRWGWRINCLNNRFPLQHTVRSLTLVCGYRMRMHFDGYSECHDFWVNANCPDIHPAGWCERTGHKLYTPKGCKEEEFSWSSYLRLAKAQVAPKELFASPGRTDVCCGFEVGMKLEAVDRMNPSLICVATVTDVVDNRFLVHFDNWDDTYDYWCDASSPYIHPIGWCRERGLPLTPPQDYPDPDNFSWEKYLEETGSTAVPAHTFKPRPPHGFQVGMKLEAVDKRSPSILRLATVEDIDPHRIKIHFDGWNHMYDEWIDADHPDIHPAGWCEATGHPLKLPLREANTPQPGPRESSASGQTSYSSLPCKGMTHSRASKYSFHHRSCWHTTAHLPGGVAQSGCFIINDNDSRLLSDLPHSSFARYVRALFRDCEETCRLPLKKIGRPPKYRKSQQRAYQSMSSEGVHPSLFMSALSAHPDRALSLCWEQHCKLLPGVAGIHASKVATWTVEEVFSFVQNLTGCEDQARLFKDEMIDGEAFLLLTQTDIVKIMSIKLGPALKIYNAILMFKSTDDGLK
uniref:L3MBTL histone methyl-lysine binding protein 1 n=1 Tax=Lepisosteus oculatus TaxID=7918 RepID=W5LZQ7_LEPOC